MDWVKKFNLQVGYLINNAIVNEAIFLIYLGH